MTAGSKRKRVMIIGQPGSGKSTLARRLGEPLQLPVVHIDRIHWKSGWIERAGPEKDLLCSEVHARDKWIFEGGRSNTWRVLKRRVEYHGVSRPDLPDGCPENINWEFVQYIWRTRNIDRLRMIKFFDSVSESKGTYRLRNRSEVEKFIRKIRDA